MDIIEKAKKFAIEAHGNQIRKYSGKPYWTHCEDVAELVRENGGNEDQEAGGWLHDVGEDCQDEYVWAMYDNFNPVICGIVDDLTNRYTTKAYPNWPRRKRKEEELSRFAGTGGHLYPISRQSALVKLCDRFCNVYDLSKEESEFGPKYYYCKETLELLEALKGTHKGLEEAIRDLCL